MNAETNNDIYAAVLMTLAQDIVAKSKEKHGNLTVGDVLEILNRHRNDVLKSQTPKP